jgi:hypothetical protein
MGVKPPPGLEIPKVESPAKTVAPKIKIAIGPTGMSQFSLPPALKEQANPPGLPEPPATAQGNEQASQAEVRPGYIWIGRFPREVGAQNAAKRIEDLGLPVRIVPRHNAVTDSDFFVVLSGPFGAEKIDDMLEKLHGAGFKNARRGAAKNPEGEQP